ncbi:MAG: hypothetical protein DKM50_10065 [Candidatus Margulisiibacteriota bacterium]|nr:MAG: hypothetical protein DKM50_10065 [Candidatus Margulisiibacteriota bacterium]
MAEEENKVSQKLHQLNVVFAFIKNPRLFRIGGYVAAILLFLYMFLAVLSFLNVVPKEIAKNLPFISSVVSRSAELDNLSTQTELTPYNLNTKIVYPKFSRVYRKDDPYVQIEEQNKEPLKDQVVMKRQFYDGKNVGEIFLNDQLVIRIYNKGPYNNEYARADEVAEKLKSFIKEQADMLKLIPKIVSGNLSIVHGNDILDQVNQADAMVNNSTPLQQAIAWINNIRIASGVTTLVKESDYQSLVQNPVVQPEVKPEVKVATKNEIVVTKLPEKLSKEDEAARTKLLKKIVRVYEAMPSGEALDIFGKMSDGQVADILSNMQDRKLAKILAVMDADRAATITKLLADKKANK